MVEIRSYRRVFDLERRIYSVDRLRLNPGGVPVRALAYFIAVLAAVLVLGGLPGIGLIMRELPWFLRDLGMPALLAALGTAVRIEGRPFHRAALSLVLHAFQSRTLAGLAPAAAVGQRWYPDELLVLPDGSEHRLRRFRFTGPGAVLLGVEHRRSEPALQRRALRGAGRALRPGLTIRPVPDARRLPEREVIVLAARVRLRIDRARRDR